MPEKTFDFTVWCPTDTGEELETEVINAPYAETAAHKYIELHITGYDGEGDGERICVRDPFGGLDEFTIRVDLEPVYRLESD